MTLSPLTIYLAVYPGRGGRLLFSRSHLRRMSANQRIGHMSTLLKSGRGTRALGCEQRGELGSLTTSGAQPERFLLVTTVGTYAIRVQKGRFLAPRLINSLAATPGLLPLMNSTPARSSASRI